jgi:drug/metabolite transporter (DMT)-like permease
MRRILPRQGAKPLNPQPQIYEFDMSQLNGILLMILAMAGFALEDLFVKLLANTISTSQILMMLGVGSASIFAVLASAKGHNIFAKHVWTRATLARNLAEAIAALAFVTALALVPLSTVAAVFQVTPLVVTMGAALFLGEQVGWRRWGAIFVGFTGVLIVIRPGLEGFDTSVLFVLISVVGVSVRDLITRSIPKTVASTVISFQAFASLFIAGSILMFVTSDAPVSISTVEGAYVAAGVVFGVAGYYGIVTAMRVADVAIVTPFRYTRLLFSILIGVIVFSERPDTLTLVGASIILATGLYTIWRERRLRSQQLVT